MADTPVSSLTALNLPVQDTDRPIIFRAGAPYQTTASALRDYLGTGSGGEPAQYITLSSNTVSENAPAETYIGQLSCSLSGGPWYFELVDNLSGSIHLSAGRGEFLYTAGNPLNYESNPSPKIEVRATRYAPNKRTVTNVIPLSLINVPEGGPAPEIDIDLINQVFTGDTLFGALGISTGNLVPRGYRVNGRGVYYDAPNSMNPSGVGWSNAGSNGGFSFTTLTPVVTSDGTFTPIRINDSGYGTARRVTGVRSLAVGEYVRVKIRMKAVTGQVDGGYSIYFGGAINRTIATLATGTEPALGDYPGGAGLCYRGKKIHTDGSFTLEFLIIAKTASPLIIDTRVRKEGGGFLDLYGISMRSGDENTGWTATGNTGSVDAAAWPSLTGNALTALLSGTFTLAIECHTGYHPPPFGLVSTGASGTTDVLKSLGRTDVSAGPASSVKAIVGLGGLLGITRTVLAQNGSGYSLIINDGKLVTSPTPLTLSAAIQLMKGTNGFLRRVSVWTTRQSNTDIRDLSSLTKRTLTQIDDAMPYGLANEAFTQDFEDRTSSIAYRGGNAQQFNQTSEANGISKYAANLNSPITRHALIPRYAHWSYEWIGSQGQTINNEPQLYLDDESFNGPSTNKPNWGTYTGPFKFDPINFPSCMGIEAKLVSELDSQAQSIIPYRQDYPNGPFSANKWAIVSGAAISAGRDEVYVNSIWTSRIKFANGDRFWGAFWNLVGQTKDGIFGGPNEYDIMEQIGQWPSEQIISVHCERYAKNVTVRYELGFDYTLDFHTWEMIWQRGQILYGVDGKFTTIFDTTTYAQADTFSLYYLLNFAAGGSFPGQPTAQTYADLAGGKIMWTDYVRAWNIDSTSPTLQPLTAQATAGAAGNFSTTINNKTLSSTVTLLESTGNKFSYNSGTRVVSATGLTAGSYDLVFVEYLSNAVDPYKTTTITITIS